jgi:hypothetical protein
MNAKSHVLISGTGRAGTTFLVQLLTELGFDTGKGHYNENCNAGLEHDLRDNNAPFIVKSPHSCDHIENIVNNPDKLIKHLIVPIRDIYSAAESRRNVQRQAQQENPLVQDVPGGLWGTSDPLEQESVLAQKLYNLVQVSCAHGIPITFLDFPRLAHDPKYLKGELIKIFGRFGLRSWRFNFAFEKVCKPHLIHRFKS